MSYNYIDIANEFYQIFRKYRLNISSNSFKLSWVFLIFMVVFIFPASDGNNPGSVYFLFLMIVSEIIWLLLLIRSCDQEEKLSIEKYNSDNGVDCKTIKEVEIDWVCRRCSISTADFLSFCNELLSLVNVHDEIHGVSFVRRVGAIFNSSNVLQLCATIISVLLFFINKEQVESFWSGLIGNYPVMAFFITFFVGVGVSVFFLISLLVRTYKRLFYTVKQRKGYSEFTIKELVATILLESTFK